jgi:hypothetical protein
MKNPTCEEKRKIIGAVASELKDLVHQDNRGQFHKRVCVICDRLTGLDNKKKISKSSLLNAIHKVPLKANPTLGYPMELIQQYSVKDSTCITNNVRDALVSPRSLRQAGQYDICSECHESICNNNTPKMPKFAIANGYAIGTAPRELTELNEYELALVSKVRVMANIFVFYGGCHQAIRGWHTFFEASVGQSIGVLQQTEAWNLRNGMFVILCGPFTSGQKAAVLRRMILRRDKVIKAYKWLRVNNKQYENEHIPNPEELPEPCIIDQS